MTYILPGGISVIAGVDVSCCSDTGVETVSVDRECCSGTTNIDNNFRIKA